MPPKQKLFLILQAHCLPQPLQISQRRLRSFTLDTDVRYLDPNDSVCLDERLESECHDVVEDAAPWMPILRSTSVAKAEHLRRQMRLISGCAAAAATPPSTRLYPLPLALKSYVFDAVNTVLEQLLPKLPGDLSWEFDSLRRTFNLLWSYVDNKGLKSTTVLAFVQAMTLSDEDMSTLIENIYGERLCVDSKGCTAFLGDPPDSQPDLSCQIVDQVSLPR